MIGHGNSELDDYDRYMNIYFDDDHYEKIEIVDVIHEMLMRGIPGGIVPTFFVRVSVNDNAVTIERLAWYVACDLRKSEYFKGRWE